LFRTYSLFGIQNIRKPSSDFEKANLYKLLLFSTE